ncbi:MAG: hypothetical protein CR988_04190 [Treponema sp.]|nr:MAG: hypothetical protein CR988_04190 [Treponema sp.]
MKTYSIKSAPNEVSYFSILREEEGGYHIRICRDIEGYEKTGESFLGEQLFETCLRTGYIEEVSHPAQAYGHFAQVS